MDGKSQKSFARSIRSRKLGPQSQALLENMQDRLGDAENRLSDLQSKVDTWQQTNEPGMNLVGRNYHDFNDMANAWKREGGFLTLENFKENPLGTAKKSFVDVQH